jgi:hypothetical protein
MGAFEPPQPSGDGDGDADSDSDADNGGGGRADLPDVFDPSGDGDGDNGNGNGGGGRAPMPDDAPVPGGLTLCPRPSGPGLLVAAASTAAPGGGVARSRYSDALGRVSTASGRSQVMAELGYLSSPEERRRFQWEWNRVAAAFKAGRIVPAFNLGIALQGLLAEDGEDGPQTRRAMARAAAWRLQNADPGQSQGQPFANWQGLVDLAKAVCPGIEGWS